MKNEEVRRSAEEMGVRLWELAEAWGVTDSNFSRKLRHEFSDKDRAKALDLIVKIVKQHEQEAEAMK